MARHEHREKSTINEAADRDSEPNLPGVADG